MLVPSQYGTLRGAIKRVWVGLSRPQVVHVSSPLHINNLARKSRTLSAINSLARRDLCQLTLPFAKRKKKECRFVTWDSALKKNNEKKMSRMKTKNWRKKVNIWSLFLTFIHANNQGCWCSKENHISVYVS